MTIQSLPDSNLKAAENNLRSFLHTKVRPLREAELPAIEMLCSFVISLANDHLPAGHMASYVGLQERPNGQQSLVMFNTCFGASVVIPIFQLSTESVLAKLKETHEKFGQPWVEDRRKLPR